MGKQSRERRERWAKVQEAREIEGLVSRARFYDRIRSRYHWEHNQETGKMELLQGNRDWLAEYTVIDAQPVYDAYDEEVYKGDDWSYSRFEKRRQEWLLRVNAMPVYTRCFIEFTSGYYVNDDGSRDYEDAKTHGVLATYYPMPDENGWRISIDEFSDTFEDLKTPDETPPDPSDPNSYYYYGDEYFGENGVFDPALFISDGGYHFKCAMNIDCNGNIVKAVKRTFEPANGQEWTPGCELVRKYVPADFDETAYIALTALTLLNVRNIIAVENTPSEADTFLYKQRFGVPMTKYKTLAIKSMSKRAGSDQPQQQFDVMPLHLRRGNFAHYTASAPLFGKFTGTFWRPATVVGNEKNGTVVKDYRVEA